MFDTAIATGIPPHVIHGFVQLTMAAILPVVVTRFVRALCRPAPREPADGQPGDKTNGRASRFGVHISTHNNLVATAIVNFDTSRRGDALRCSLVDNYLSGADRATDSPGSRVLRTSRARGSCGPVTSRMATAFSIPTRYRHPSETRRPGGTLVLGEPGDGGLDSLFQGGSGPPT